MIYWILIRCGEVDKPDFDHPFIFSFRPNTNIYDINCWQIGNQGAFGEKRLKHMPKIDEVTLTIHQGID